MRMLKRIGTACVAVACVMMLAAAAEKATSAMLGGADRYLTHVGTDKPIYRTGETVYIRAVVLNAADATPLPEKERANAKFEIKGPKGDIVASGRAVSQESAVGFAWKVPEGTPGGEYTARVSYDWQGHPPAERTFDIRVYRAPRLKTQVIFVRDGYGPGDRVMGSVTVERAEGGIPVGARVTAVARVDGAEIHRAVTSVGAYGEATASFELPQEIERGEGTLAFVIEDGGVVETAAKTIPIILRTLDLEMYPEGGDLVTGLASRVYVEARTPWGKPADFTGSVVDDAGAEVARFSTEHEGRGRFSITPEKGRTYTLKVVEPAGVVAVWTLPEAKPDGAIITSVRDVYEPGDVLELKVASTKKEMLSLGLYKHEKELSSLNVECVPGAVSTVTLTPPSSAFGVLRVTAWDAKDAPVAERLIFRRPEKQLGIEITPDKQQYVPGDEVTLTVKTTDEDGKPVSAVVGLTVTDDAVLEMIETREQAPRLPVMVLLESDVRELADAEVYLDPTNPVAPLALDLLLGTQGWRRFAFMHVEEFVEEYKDDALRALAMRKPVRPQVRHAFRGGVGGVDMALEDASVLAMAGAVEKREGGPEVKAVNAPPPPADDAEPDAADAFGAGDDAVEVAEEQAAPRGEEDGKKRQEPARKVLADPDAGLVFEDEEVMARERRIMPRPAFVSVREYAHQVRPDRKPGDRVDFAETLYWNAGVRTDEETGETKITFGLSDSVTSFRVFADGYTDRGVLGMADAAVESVEPFYCEPKLPLEVTQGDVVRLPVSVVNATQTALDPVRITVTAPEGVDVEQADAFALGGNERVRRIVVLRINEPTASGPVVITADGAGSYMDTVTRPLRVVPKGFPVEIGSGGVITPDGDVVKKVTVPETVVPGSITTSLDVFPTPLANLTEALERLIRDPYGCFEQTSSTTYPLVMAQQYFTTHAGVDPAVVEQANKKLDAGYKRLVSFECPEKGYEWFGGDPGHEALTAYGLLEFVDMGKVRDVDDGMVRRTRNWLLARRDGDGGFKRNERALDSFGRAPEATTNAYCTWALLEAGETGLEKEIAWVKKDAESTKDTYVVALAANILHLSGDEAGAKAMRRKLVASQEKDGHVADAVTSITRSGGVSLDLEATSLAVLAWLEDDDFAGNVEDGMRFIVENCKNGRFGSTQSTVLALRAIVAYDAARAAPKKPGSLQVFVDGEPVGEAVPFDEKTTGALALPDISDALAEPGEHTVEVRMSDGSKMPYALAVEYNALTPATSDACQVGLVARLVDAELQEGDVTEVRVTASNTGPDGVPTPLAIVGLPGGLEPRHDQLKELVEAGTIAAYEVLGREVVLYWREMKKDQKIDLPISCVAAVPGSYTGPASRGYLYYTDEHKQWTEGLSVVIEAK